ncbi:hypothetical protein CNMCM5878_000680 [Aspergillus fumigatiaffinis]|nr:hypothetical protein CNMCM5878_000680 [Aspergillus fumigatiaffinis]KAF4219021.1 hypothetical protein CNMCM6457_003284 [Aspergillus fumigatiaffinis]
MSPTTARRDYYAVLEIPPSADLTTITNAYKRMALEKHPDRYKSRDATAEFQLAARPVRFGRKLRRAPVEDLTAEERAVEHQALQMSMANIFELFRRDVSALLDGDDEDAEDDDDNQSVASEHMDFDDHIAAPEGQSGVPPVLKALPKTVYWKSHLCHAWWNHFADAKGRNPGTLLELVIVMVLILHGKARRQSNVDCCTERSFTGTIAVGSSSGAADWIFAGCDPGGCSDHEFLRKSTTGGAIGTPGQSGLLIYTGIQV